jgi:hypothetical protein
LRWTLGFAASELCSRIEHAEPKVLIAANCGVEPNKVIHYLDILHEVRFDDMLLTRLFFYYFFVPPF